MPLMLLFVLSAAASLHDARALDTHPQQIHIAVAGGANCSQQVLGDCEYTGLSVMWYTTDDTAASVLQYGSSAASLSDNASGSSEQYLADHGYHHSAAVTTLTPGTPFFYRVGDGAGAWSDTFRASAPPAASEKAYPFGVSVFGDMGYLGSKERPMVLAVAGLKRKWTAVPTRARLEQLKNDGEIDMVFHVGDIGYIDDAFAHDPIKFMYEGAYNGYMNWLMNLTTTMPYMVSPGNHESECHIATCAIEEKKYGLHLNNFTAYNKRWNMPSASSGGALNMWYSFDYGPVHFVSLNSETDFPAAEERAHGDASSMPAGGFGRKGEYLQWLEQDLKQAAANRAVRPWIIAGGHRPCCGDIPGVQQLFQKYGVAAYFAGHAHSYWRTAPTFANMTVDSKAVLGDGEGALPAHTTFDAANAATTYIVAGGAGCDEMDIITEEEAKASHSADDWHSAHDCDGKGICLRRTQGENPQEGDPAKVKSSPRMLSGVLTVLNASTLHYRAIASTDGSIVDEVFISQPPL